MPQQSQPRFLIEIISPGRRGRIAHLPTWEAATQRRGGFAASAIAERGRHAIFGSMTLHARLLACLVALSLVLGIGAGGAYATDAMNDPAATSMMDNGTSRDCGDCGTEKAAPCATGIQCALPMAIMPAQPAVTMAKPTIAYRIADAVVAGRIGAPEPYPPKA